jgi:putative CocE/NonD family hydrolase
MDVTIEKNLRVPMRDGIELVTDVYRPAGAEQCPVILIRTPYNKDGMAGGDDSFNTLLTVQHGYAVVVQDCRGTGASPGEFAPFVNEASDGADALAWVVAEPWCSGEVGMAGASYFGMTQWLAASESPQVVKAIVPVFSSPRAHDGWAYQGGAFHLNFSLFWFAGLIAPTQVVRGMRQGTADPAELGALFAALNKIDELFRRLPLTDMPEIAARTPDYFEWLAHPAPDDFWQQRQPADLSQIGTPALMVGGWYDVFLRGTIASYEAIKSSSGSAPHARLIIGPWAHANPSGSYPERDFGPMSGLGAADVVGATLSWFDRHLKGIEPEDDSEAPVRIFVMGPNIWRDELDWPLPDTVFTEYHLHSTGLANHALGDGTLTGEPASQEPPDSYLYDPRDPVPTVGGSVLLPGAFVSANSGPRDQAEIEERHDVLCFTGAPLADDLEVTGPVELVLFASSSALDTDFTAKLVDVSPDGRAELVTDGILRARYRESLSRPQLLKPGEVYEFLIELGATSRVFPAGHRIRLDISSSNFPRFDRNTNSGGTIAADGSDDLVVALNRVFHDGQHPSRLVLPLIDRS